MSYVCDRTTVITKVFALSSNYSIGPTVTSMKSQLFSKKLEWFYLISCLCLLWSFCFYSAYVMFWYCTMYSM